VKESTQVLLGLGVGLASGIAIAASHNPSLLRAADAIAPVGTLWVNAIRMTVIPLVVSLVITGVASASDLKAVGRLGGRTLVVFISMLKGATLIKLPLGIALFAWLPHLIPVRPSLPPGAIEAAQSLTSGAPNVSFGSWLISLIPTNPVNAAANGAMLPLILFTLFFALAIGKAPAAARTTLLGFFSAVTETMLVLVRWVVRLAPIGIFGLMVPLGAHGGVGLAGAIGFYVVAYSAASVLFVLLLYPALKILVRLPMRVFARAALPAQLIAFSSSSSIASLPALVEGAESD
jgi:Na+/H+-dicarboxylate symporter